MKFLHETSVADHLKSGELLPLLRDWEAEPRALYLTYPRHREGGRALWLFVEFVVESFRSPSPATTPVGA